MLLKSLAQWTARNPWKTVIGWVVALVFFGAIQSIAPLNSTASFELKNNPESEQAWDLIVDTGIRDERQGSETVIVRAAPAALDDGTVETAVNSIAASLAADTETVASVTNYFELLDTAPDAAANLIQTEPQDGSGLITVLIPVTLAGDLETAVENGADFMETYDAAIAQVSGVEVMTFGDASLNEEINTITEEDIAQGESIGAAIAFVILIIVFGALVAAFVPIVLAFISIGIALGMTAIFSQIFELSFFVTSMISMIGLAVGIDYSLFVVRALP